MFHAETTFLAMPFLFSSLLFSSFLFTSFIGFFHLYRLFLLNFALSHTFDLPHLPSLSFVLPFSLTFSRSLLYFFLTSDRYTYILKYLFKSSATYKHKTQTILIYEAPVWRSTCSYNYRRLQVIHSQCLRFISIHPRRTPHCVSVIYSKNLNQSPLSSTDVELSVCSLHLPP